MTKPSDEILTGAVSVATFLHWHVNTLRKYAAKYPPRGAKLNGLWNVRKTEILAWRDYVVEQESRHVEARRFRPAEPPELTEIKGRRARRAE